MSEEHVRPLLPVSGVVPTRNRAAVLGRTLETIYEQRRWPSDIVVVDASDDDRSRKLVEGFARRVEPGGARVTWCAARTTGAAAQRNQGVELASQPFVWFFDDDILLEQDCLDKLYEAITSDDRLGGVNAMIVNQRYVRPGRVSASLFRLMAGDTSPSYAGRLLGPAINLLPEDRPDLPDVVPVEWLNTTCTLYRREALPAPPFPPHFFGYSMMEDVSLSAVVGRTWRLANARGARIFHDTQSGDHKGDPVALAKMELLNRYYVTTAVLGRTSFRDALKLTLWELFQLAASARERRLGPDFWRAIKGKCLALGEIVSANRGTDPAR